MTIQPQAEIFHQNTRKNARSDRLSGPGATTAVLEPNVSVPDDPFMRKLSAFVVFSEGEQETLARLRHRRRTFLPEREMIHEGQKIQSAFIVESGWACSFKLLPDGGRQIIDFHVPGDVVGLRNILLHRSDRSVEAMTQVVASEVPASEISKSLTSPRLAIAVLWAAVREEATVAEHLVNIGRRPAAVRTAHFLLELGTRLNLVGLGNETGFDCPLTQSHIADALGLSPVHVNRVLRRLREDGLLTFQRDQVSFSDLNRLRNFSGFTPEYLFQAQPAM